MKRQSPPGWAQAAWLDRLWSPPSIIYSWHCSQRSRGNVQANDHAEGQAVHGLLVSRSRAPVREPQCQACDNPRRHPSSSLDVNVFDPLKMVWDRCLQEGAAVGNAFWCLIGHESVFDDFLGTPTRGTKKGGRGTAKKIAPSTILVPLPRGIRDALRWSELVPRYPYHLVWREHSSCARSAATCRAYTCRT